MSRRQRRLLLALLVVRDGAVDVDRSADIVWGHDESLPQHPAAAVRVPYVHYRDLLRARLSKPERNQILERADHLDRELARTPTPRARRTTTPLRELNPSERDFHAPQRRVP